MRVGKKIGSDCQTFLDSSKIFVKRQVFEFGIPQSLLSEKTKNKKKTWFFFFFGERLLLGVEKWVLSDQNTHKYSFPRTLASEVTSDSHCKAINAQGIYSRDQTRQNFDLDWFLVTDPRLATWNSDTHTSYQTTTMFILDAKVQGNFERHLQGNWSTRNWYDRWIRPRNWLGWVPWVHLTSEPSSGVT